MPVYVLILAALAGLALFLVLNPRNKVLLSFIVLSSLFDLLPTIMNGFYVRDPGFVLMGITWAQLLLRRRVVRLPTVLFVRAIQGLVVWAAICVLYGVLVNDYPLLLTLKASRQWILGYCTFFVFVRLYETDPGAFQYLVKWLYRITAILVPVVLIQFLSGLEIFYGLIREYGGAVRALPVFLPVCLMFTWFILSRLLAGQKVEFHEKVYVLLTIVMAALTYTRGIYLAFIATFLVMLVLLGMAGRLRASRTLGYIGAAVVGLALLLSTGAMDRVANRFLSGLNVIRGVEIQRTTYADDIDTFTGRLKLVGERISLAAEQNPLVGFAFIHENLVSSSVRASLRYGGPINTPEYQKQYALGMPYVMSLHQVDIGWADIVTDTGLVGLILTLVLLGGVLTRQIEFVTSRRSQAADYFWATGLFLELFMLTLLMFNGNPYVQNVHFVSFMLASFAFCSSREVSVDSRLPFGHRQFLGA